MIVIPRTAPNEAEPDIFISGISNALNQEIKFKPAIPLEMIFAIFNPSAKAITQRPSSKAITANKVLVKGPFALHSRMMAMVAAGAVAQEMAPKIMAEGSRDWK